MEAHCLPGRINISEAVAGHAKALFELEPRGSIEAKHERAYEMYFLNGLRQEFSRETLRRLPNDIYSPNMFALEEPGMRNELQHLSTRLAGPQSRP
jgi:hypothetical protein